MSEHVPAWKRLGLKVKNAVVEDPLVLATHIESADVTQKKAKELKRKRQAIASADKEKKPPKRVKLPKSERPPPPEKDQLAYLRQYSEDRDNWKFSKQKQNWILKNIRHIPEMYVPALEEYVGGMVGGSRERLVETLRGVVTEWNVAAEKVALALEQPQENETKEEEKKEESKDNKKDSKKDDDQEPAVDFDYAKRARDLIHKMTGDSVVLSGLIEEPEEVAKQEPEEESEELSVSPVEEPANAELVKTDRSNLIIDEVEATEYVDEDDFKTLQKTEGEQKIEEKIEDKAAKKSKKEKKEKKKSKKEKKEKKSKD